LGFNIHFTDHFDVYSCPEGRNWLYQKDYSETGSWDIKGWGTPTMLVEIGASWIRRVWDYNNYKWKDADPWFDSGHDMKEKKINVIPSCCFPVGTKITMVDKSYKNIEDVNIGDSILSYDPISGDYSSWTVNILSKPIHPVVEINNGLICATEDHPFFVKTNNGDTCWAAVEPLDYVVRGINGELHKLSIGDCLLNSDGE
ncbi:MAG: hypothetical protein MUO82_08565, partial [Candidatus Thermoplasmatota archaeon]|nr:hypothetical protein [Candidatus Thermoplasmatota archaeon]